MTWSWQPVSKHLRPPAEIGAHPVAQHHGSYQPDRVRTEEPQGHIVRQLEPWEAGGSAVFPEEDVVKRLLVHTIPVDVIGHSLGREQS